MTPELLSVALAAGLALPARLPGAPTLRGVAGGPVAGAPQPYLAVPLAEAVRLQEDAGQTVTLGGVEVHLGFALAPDGDLPVVFAQGGSRAAWSWAELEKGQAADFPAGRLSARLDGRWLVVSLGAAEQRVWLNALIARVYDGAARVKVPAVDYAVLVQGSAADPDAVGLLRRDGSGNFFVAYRTRAEMAGINWFVAVNGTLYGMRPEKGLLIVYSKPLPPEQGLKKGGRRAIVAP